MTLGRLILRSFVHYARSHLGVMIGCALTSIVLSGALLVGDSVRASLREQAMQRIGRADYVLGVGDRFFGDDLADRALADAGLTDDLKAAPVLMVRGVAVVGGGKRRANDVQVLGVDSRFFELSLEGEAREIDRGEVVLNERLARQLEVEVGDRVSFRMDKPSALPRDMAFATNEETISSLSLKVADIVDESQGGRFSMLAHQIPPFNAFVNLGRLQKTLEREGRTNLVLVGSQESDEETRARRLQHLDASLEVVWTLEDAEMRGRELPDQGAFELATDRVFLDPAVADAVPNLSPDVVPILVYFVNELRLGEKMTPYSTVGAIGGTVTDSPIAPNPALGENEIALVDWTAEDLGASVGDTIEVAAYALAADGSLEEERAEFTVASIVPLEGAYADPNLMPDYPGIGDAENCADWEPGIPVDLDLIRDKDEDYWDEHRGSPKAYLNLDRALSWWTTRFGSLTALRSPLDQGEVLRQNIRQSVGARTLGLYFRDLRTPALAAANPATDFGGLFLGLSLFLIVAAVLLTTMLFVFGAEQRADQVGLLLALGYRPFNVRLILLGEAGVSAVVGAALGAAGGVLYTSLVLRGLASIWQGAVASAQLDLHVSAVSLVLGGTLAALAAAASIFLALRHLARRPAVALLQGEASVAIVEGKTSRRGWWIAGGFFLAGVVLALATPASGSAAAGAFFGAGSLCLIAGIVAVRTRLHQLGGHIGAATRLTSLLSLARLNTTRRPGRSVATVTLLAAGCFLVLSVGVHRQTGVDDPWDRQAGTGGFALIGRSTLPVLEDLHTDSGREVFALQEDDLRDATIVPFRVQDGDEASCLNLSYSQNPRLVAVEPRLLAEREAFPFAATIEEPKGGVNPWAMLDAIDPEGAIPVIGDAASTTWALKIGVGDTLEYLDERGEPFQVRLVATVAGTILQGDLVMSERRFEALFPTTAGHRLFLIDTSKERVDEVRTTLSEGLVDVGLELTPTQDRLAELQEVQNTYLLIFQTLGALGLLLGSAGMATVVARNVLDRRHELAVARALGYRLGLVRRLILVEHGALLGLGLVVGAAAALLAVVPTLLQPGGGSPGVGALFFLAVAALGAVWIGIATVLTVRGSTLDALRDE